MKRAYSDKQIKPEDVKDKTTPEEVRLCAKCGRRIWEDIGRCKCEGPPPPPRPAVTKGTDNATKEA